MIPETLAKRDRPGVDETNGDDRRRGARLDEGGDDGADECAEDRPRGHLAEDDAEAPFRGGEELP